MIIPKLIDHITKIFVITLKTLHRICNLLIKNKLVDFVFISFFLFQQIVRHHKLKKHIQNTPGLYLPSLFGTSLLLALFLILDLVFPLKISTDYSTIITSSDNTVIGAFLNNEDKWRMFTELKEITPTLNKAIIFKEDKYFRYHPGVNIFAILRASFNNFIKNKRTSGASTITMQVARLLEPKERSYFNKIIEIFRALQIEYHYNKDEIFQLYLNLVPYGGNIEGVKAASVLYFQKSPNHLSLAEITTLSIIPNRPNTLKIGKNNDLIIQERNLWLTRFKKAGLFNKQDIEDALLEPLGALRNEAPKSAPHFSLRMLSKYPESPIIKTNLDLKIQLKIEQLVKNHIARLYWKNIKNATVLVVENKTGKVVSYIGSADFFNKADAGEVDGIKAIRSPGSTLKPLLFGFAFEKGLLTPKKIILDVPVNFSGYEPENFDERFYGRVNAEFALSHSLNVPAVKLLNQVGEIEFINLLKNAGFRQIAKDEKKLGMSVILGGCGVTSEELCRMYHAFANNGIISNFSWIQSDTSLFKYKILSEEACYMITDILTKVSRPDLPVEWQNTSNLPNVAWKTGTSYGRKDAWSIGFNKKYTIAVWVGNFSSEGVQELSGAECAAPLLFKIFNSLEFNSSEEWFSPPKQIKFRMVCSESGLPPNDFCKNLVIDYFIPGVSSNLKCNHLKEYYISPDSAIAFCTNCLPESGFRKKMYLNLEPELISYYEQNQIKYEKVPVHNPKCERVFSDGNPEINSPINAIEYLIDKQDSTQILLQCNTSSDVSKVFWYVNDKFVKSAKPNQKVFIIPPEGKVKISCSDDKARNTNIWITVKYITY